MEIEILLATEAVSYAQASRFVLDAANAAVFVDPGDAFNFAFERNWLPRNATPSAEARLDGIALLMMRSFGLRGGFMFSVTGSPHFAYREMEYHGFIHGRVSPNQRVSGETLLYLVGRLLDRFGDTLPEITGIIEPQRVDQPAAFAAFAEQIYTQLEFHTDINVAVVEEGIMISLTDILFLADSAEIPHAEMQTLYEIAGILRGIPGRIAVTGHTALAGTEEGRLQLSTERARAIADFLISQGVRQPWEITATGYGAERPVADNDTQEGMATNRRVEITILEN